MQPTVRMGFWSPTDLKVCIMQQSTVGACAKVLFLHYQISSTEMLQICKDGRCNLLDWDLFKKWTKLSNWLSFGWKWETNLIRFDQKYNYGQVSEYNFLVLLRSAWLLYLNFSQGYHLWIYRMRCIPPAKGRFYRIVVLSLFYKCDYY